MLNFFVALWESVFQPGTTPQLIIATHVSFIALLGTLGWLIHATSGNIHFYALFTIALLLWFAVIWFIQELKNVQLKDNEELESKVEENNDIGAETRNSGKKTTTGAEIEEKQSNLSTQLRSRKV